ncbi:MAG: DMT family transporter [Roseibium sp.]|uniref:DMT family transporter n=1 Tax=Roseibium sp. TaxID=1936156 RepID=UPI00260999F5|nr:DMT family transporter [Roseibium sp.]MCV0425396.1 DMT family transporter [Roseibium sp.]
MFTASPLLLSAIICGAFIPVHAAMNASLSRTMGHPIWATVVSFGISFLCLCAFLILFRPTLPTWTSFSTTPVWAWLSGLVGVTYVISAMLLAPRLGAASFIASVVAGQMLMALVLDHYGLLGFSQRTVEPARFIGALLVIAGVVAMQLSSGK